MVYEGLIIVGDELVGLFMVFVGEVVVRWCVDWNIFIFYCI